MPLALYRRHRQNCKGKHPHNSRTSEYDERKKNWRRCECPIFVSGTIGKDFRRQNTGRWQWVDAQTVAGEIERAGKWEGTSAPIPVPEPPEPSTQVRVTLERAINAFTAEFEEHAALNTQKKYRLLLAKLRTFSDGRGYVMLDQWTPLDVREMRSSWEVAPQTAAKDMSTVKAFFEFCLANEWIPRNPARLVKNQRTRDSADRRNEQKLPFSDEELKRMYEACDTKYGKQEIKWSREIHHRRIEGHYARYNSKWTGQDLADFISVSLYTGLRISDVATFHVDRMKPSGEILLRTTKAGTHVYTWVPAWLQERIRARATEYGPYIFGEHTTKDTNVVTDVWRRKLIKLWSFCGPFKEKPTPHRFRHTFARILLQRPGVTVRDVAELLGNSEQMVRRHYAAWIPAPFLAVGGFNFTCMSESISIASGEAEKARWSDWTYRLEESLAGNLPPSTGQALRLHQSLIDDAQRRRGGTFAWLCRITAYQRKHLSGPFDVARFALDLGTTSVVRDISAR